MSKSRVLVCGAGGFIGGHLVKRLKSEGYWVRGADIKQHEFEETASDEFIQGDLRDPDVMKRVVDGIEDMYQLAADMGGAGYIFTGEHDANVMHNSATINLNAAEFGRQAGVKRFFYSSSACIYPAYNQMDPDNPKCSEESAYPAEPDSEYGWEKLFSERLYLSYMRNHGLTVRVDHRGPGVEAGRSLRQPCAARLPRPGMETRSKSGAMESRLAPSCTSTSALRQFAA
jgi:GDP-D-mannose 3',5'-epimerase